MDSPVEPVPDPVQRELAAFLDARREELLDAWKAALRLNRRARQVPAVDNQGLIDHLPKLYDDLIANLRGEPAASARTGDDAHYHGQARWQQGYTLGEVLRELGIVSRLLFERGYDPFAEAHAGWDREALRPTRETVLGFFEDTACGSAQQYVFRQQEQTEAVHQEVRREEQRSAAVVQNDYDRLAGMFQRSPSFLAILRGPDHVFHLANDQYGRITGHRALLGKPVREALPEVVAQGYVELLNRVYTTGEPYVGNDVRLLLKDEADGSLQEHFIDFVYLPTRTADGAVEGILVHGVDWTERKRAQQTADELAELRRLALDSARMGTWHLDLVTQYVHWDDQFKAVFGVADEELSLERALTLLHPDDRETVRDAITAASRPDDPVPYAIEYRAAQPDGAWRWIQAHGKTYYEGEGAVRRAIKLVGTVRDITEARFAQEALLASEAKYRALFDSVDSAFCVLEMIWDEAGRPVDYRFVEVNPAFERHNGFHQPQGKTALELVPNLETRWFEIFGEIARSGEPRRFTEGSAAMGRWFDLYAFPLGNDANRRVAVIFSDISVRLQAEEALRTAKAEAEAASRAKDDFLAALSHELRTPLTPVLMAASDLCDDPALPAQARETLRMMQRNIGLEARLIDDLLDLTRIAKGKLELRAQDCEVHSIVGLAVEIVRDDAQAKGIRLGLELAARRTYFIGDPARVQQVFWNLLKNAVKFTPAGGRITVRSRDEGDQLVVEVHDTGIGLAPESLEIIFQPFEQAGLVNNARFGGLGLGLAIAKTVVELHGGTLRAESGGLGRGATFRVALTGNERPAEVIDEGNRPDAAAPTPPASMPTSAMRRLLLVEDHEATLQVLARLLVRTGYAVVTATSVAAAKEAAAAGRFDVVISDVGLPDGTGIELMDSLHANYGLRGIALTGYGMEDDLRRSREVGFVEHLVKPTDFGQLRQAIERVSSAKN